MRLFPRYPSIFSWPIRAHLILLVVLTSLPFLVVMIVSSHQQHEQIVNQMTNETKTLVLNVVAQHETVVAGAQQLLNTLAHLPEVQAKEAEPLSALFATLLRENKQYANILLADPEGNVLASARPFQPPLSIADRKFFRDVISSHRFSPGEYVIGRTANKPLFNYGGPVFDRNGQLLAVLAVGIDLEYITDIFSHFNLPPGSNLGVTDHRGIIVYRAQEPEKYLGKPAYPPNFQAMQADGIEGSFANIGVDGVHRRFFYHKITIAGSSSPYLYILAGIPEQYLRETSRAVTLNYIELFSCLFIVALVMAHLLAKYAITDRVRELLAAINALAVGELGHKVSTKVQGGELGLLAVAFDQMHAALRAKEEEQREAEQEKNRLESRLRQSYKMEAIGTLAGGIAHDFNNMLTPILGYAELLTEKLPSDSPLLEELMEISKAGQRAKELVKQILTFSRQGEQASMPIQLHLIVKEALKLLRSSTPSSIEFRQEIDDHCGQVLADPTQIHQVVMNLVTNGYHAMRDSGGVLTVTCKAVTLPLASELERVPLTPGPYVCLSVHDTGVGIEPAIRERIFEPYFTTKRQGEGTGLGLSVTHGIVKNLGGAITIASGVGEGTTFHVYFPLLATPAPLPPPPLDQDGHREGTERVLVVDDEPTIANLHRTILEGHGYRVTATTSSSEALHLVERDPLAFDLVVTDMTMPELNGAELARRLLALRPGLPIILCTGFSELIDAEQAKAMGIRRYLMKPIVAAELTKAIGAVLAGNSPAGSPPPPSA